jgi:hypothetical protein
MEILSPARGVGDGEEIVEGGSGYRQCNSLRDVLRGWRLVRPDRPGIFHPTLSSSSILFALLEHDHTPRRPRNTSLGKSPSVILQNVDLILLKAGLHLRHMWYERGGAYTPLPYSRPATTPASRPSHPSPAPILSHREPIEFIKVCAEGTNTRVGDRCA